ncbi:MAG: DEAD/DEAH box helicase family protein [Ignavibacteriales bacterium]|nr:DEAD/DEAH box helicase family protein [Ignavibacteriales bacterium]
MPNRVSEATTRYNIIDPQLKKVGWNVSDRTKVGMEIPVSGYDTHWEEGITDYCLYRANGEVLAVVEAKRTSRDARVGEKQVYDYVTAIEKKQSFRPFAFLTNGDDIFFWDTDVSSLRRVAGFFSPENLERLLFLKLHKLPLNMVTINDNIVNRAYQVEAIRRISEAIEVKKKRKALLVMATGTGKTRTIMALIDVFLKAHAAQKILFLADRDALVSQALTDGFKTFLPDESRARIRTYATETTARVYVATLQTLELCYDKFTPADFDVIISDECHRSIYNKFTDVLAYFDAVQIGLTATPAEFIDRDSFKFFDCDNSIPTFLYTYDVAVKENYLADFNVYAAQTKFQRKGIKGVDLSDEERTSLEERGIDPDTIDFEGTDLERKVTNKDTLKRQWEEFMDFCIKDATGQLPGKTIVFAITHKHAMRLAETFNEMYPEYNGKLIQVIDSKMERARDLLDNFKKQDMPRIAISVDMLDTGVDIPEVVNLAFMKPVNSHIKFWQMIGRGTRHHSACKHFEWLPNKKKEDFLIVDYWENFEHFQMKPNEEEKTTQVPVLVTIFNTRLQKLSLLLNNQTSEDAKRIINDARKDIARIPLQSFSVKRAFNEVKEVWEDDFWNYLTANKLDFLRLKVAPLLRFVPHIQPPKEFFVSKMERCGLALLQKKDLQTHIDSIREDVSLLPTNISEVATKRDIIEMLLSNDFKQSLTLAKLDEVRDVLAPLMKYKREKPSLVIELGLDDIIDSRKWVVLKKDSQRIFVEEYRKRIEEKIEQLAQRHPTIQKLKRKEAVSLEDFILLEETLEGELGSDEIDLNDDNMLKAFGVRVGSFVDFLKHILNIEQLPTYETIVRKSFDAFILEHNYNADQSRFLRAVQTVFLQTKKINVADLYEEPFTNFGMNAVEKLFTQSEIDELILLTKKLAV